MTEKGFVAQVSGKNGKALHTTAAHPSREEAAEAAFKARPKATKCSSCKAHEGKPTHMDIRWHNRPADKKPVKETVSFLIEDAFEKSELVAAAQAILSKLQDTAEKIASVLPDDVMPIQDAMAERFGPDAAMKFNSTASDQLGQLVNAVQTAKTAIGNEVLRLKRIANGESGSDAAMDMDAPLPPDAPPEGDLPPDGMPPENAEGPEGVAPEGPPEGAGPLDAEPQGGNFAGREQKKESAHRRGRKLRENAMQHPNFEMTRASFESFAPECAGLVGDILDRIHHLPMAGVVRDGLTHVLQHVMEQALSPMVWDNPQAVLQMGLTTHFPQMPSNVDVKIAGEIDAIKKEITRLTHKIADAHERGVATGMPMESRITRNVGRLREARNPDRMILTVFRRVLAECRSPVKAATGTARAFSIDVGDVVTIVREAKQADVYKQIRAMGLTVKKDEAGDHVVNYKGAKPGEGHFTDDLDDALGTAKQMAKKMPKAKTKGKVEEKSGAKAKESDSDKGQLGLALKTLKMSDAGGKDGMTKAQARKFLRKIGYSDERIAKLEEDVAPALMGKRMGVQADDPNLVTALAGQVPPGQPPVPGKPVKPLTPADMQAQKLAQKREDDKNKAAGKPMTPIGAKPKMAATNKVVGMKPPGTVVTPSNINRM